MNKERLFLNKKTSKRRVSVYAGLFLTLFAFSFLVIGTALTYEPQEAAAITKNDVRAGLELNFANISYNIEPESTAKAMPRKGTISKASLFAATFGYQVSDLPEKYHSFLHNNNPQWLRKFWALRKLGFESSEIYKNLAHLDQYVNNKMKIVDISDDQQLHSWFTLAGAAGNNDSSSQTGGSVLTYETYKIEDLEATDDVSINSSVYNNWGNPIDIYQGFAEALAELNTSKSTMTKHYDVSKRRHTIFSGFIQTEDQVEAIFKANIAANESTSSDTITPDRIDDLTYDVDYAVLNQYVSQSFVNYVRGAANQYLQGESASANIVITIFGIKVLEIPRAKVPFSFLFPQPVYAIDPLALIRDAFGGFMETATTIGSDTVDLISGIFPPPTGQDWASIGDEYFDQLGWGQDPNHPGGSITPHITDDLDNGQFDPLGWIMASLSGLSDLFVNVGGQSLNMVGSVGRNITGTLLDDGLNLIAGPFFSIIGGVKSFVSSIFWAAVIIGGIGLLVVAWIVYRRRSEKSIIPFA